MRANELDNYFIFFSFITALIFIYLLLYQEDKRRITDSSIGFIASIKKNVLIKNSKEIDWLSISHKEYLAEDDIIYSPEGSYAEINLVEQGVTIQLKENSLIKVKKDFTFSIEGPVVILQKEIPELRKKSKRVKIILNKEKITLTHRGGKSKIKVSPELGIENLEGNSSFVYNEKVITLSKNKNISLKQESTKPEFLTTEKVFFSNQKIVDFKVKNKKNEDLVLGFFDKFGQKVKEKKIQLKRDGGKDYLKIQFSEFGTYNTYLNMDSSLMSKKSSLEIILMPSEYMFDVQNIVIKVDKPGLLKYDLSEKYKGMKKEIDLKRLGESSLKQSKRLITNKSYFDFNIDQDRLGQYELRVRFVANEKYSRWSKPQFITFEKEKVMRPKIMFVKLEDE